LSGSAQKNKAIHAPAMVRAAGDEDKSKIWRLFIMNKTELIAAVAEKATISKKDAENAVSAVIASITESLAGGEKVQIAGFGTFEVRERGERVGRDPRTSAEIVIPASKAPAFKAGKALKESVNK
jgi:DNA-binding protein HU-beta